MDLIATNDVDLGKCQCGCGQSTTVSKVNDRSKGWVKGEPVRFIKGHGIHMAGAIKSDRALGNRYTNTNGYIMVTMGNGYQKYEHILMAEKALGRPLRQYGKGHANNEVVHHINGDKTDNRNENLLICTHSYHTSLHYRLEKSPEWPEFQPVNRRGVRSND